MIGIVRDKIWGACVNWLTNESNDHRLSPNDFDVINEKIQPGDVLLVEGRTRVGGMIKTLTRCSFSHSAICIGRQDEIEDLGIRAMIHEHYDGPNDVPLLVEAELGRGTVITPVDFYRTRNCRIARPIGLSESDAKKIVAFMVSHLGDEYDVKQLLDLARFLIPWSFIPRKWQSSLFEHNAGQATKNVCSSLIAEAFGRVGFPILPLVERAENGQLHFYRRNPKLFTPRDFDYSPFFKILKYPLLRETPEGYYRVLSWQQADEQDSLRLNYMNADDIVFVSRIEEESEDLDAMQGMVDKA